MKGRPHYLRCSQYRYADAGTAEHKLLSRTGRTRPARTRRVWRDMGAAHEYRCSCGHVGWTEHPDVLRLPVETG